MPLSLRRLRVKVLNWRLFTFRWRVRASTSSDFHIPHCERTESPSVPVIVNRRFLPPALNTSSFSECVAGRAAYAKAPPPLDFIVILLRPFFSCLRLAQFSCVTTFRHPLQSALLSALVNLSATWRLWVCAAFLENLASRTHASRALENVS